MNPAPPEIVPFTFGDKPRSEGQSATVTCSVDGDKPVGVRWMLNEKEIDGSMNVTVIPLGDAGSIISIAHVTAQHVGWYTCIARNLAGVTQHSAQLSVTGTSECKSCMFLTCHSFCFFITVLCPNGACLSAGFIYVIRLPQSYMTPGWCGGNTLDFCSGGMVLNPVCDNTYSNYGFCGFSQYLQANAGIIPWLGHGRFFVNHQS